MKSINIDPYRLVNSGNVKHVDNTTKEHGLTENRRLNVQNLVSQRMRGWAYQRGGNYQKFHFQKVGLLSTFTITRQWMEALAIKLP